MGQYFQSLAKDAGFQDEEIQSYLDMQTQDAQLPDPLLQPVKQSDQLLPEINRDKPSSPNIVEPFRSPESTVMTQGFGANPRYYGRGGHQGVDLKNVDPSVTNPIGGINVSGYQRGGYGNYNAVVGASPEELAQMKPSEIEAIRNRVRSQIQNGASSLNQVSVPGKNIEIQGHLAAPAPDVSTVATGSANLRMGSTGRSTGPHLHQEFKDTKGQQQTIQKAIQKYLYK